MDYYSSKKRKRFGFNLFIYMKKDKRKTQQIYLNKKELVQTLKRVNMKFLYLLLNTLFLQGLSLRDKRLCVNCLFFKKDYWWKNEYGKCTFFPKRNVNKNYFIDDFSVVDLPDYNYCSSARKSKNMCGEDGLMFIKRKKKLGYK